MANWKIQKLSEVLEIVMGQSPEGSSCNQSGEGTPLLNGPTEFGSWNPIPVQYTISPKRYAEANDLLFCVRGSTTGRMNWADQQYAIGRGLAAIRHKSGYEYQPFVRAVIEIALKSLLNQTTGSTFPNLSKEQLNNFEFAFPDLPTQHRIAEILSALDDKIELNRRMNQTLEQMAQTLFQQYFVDSIDEENLPEGWRWGKIIDLFELQRGFDLPATKRIAGAVPVFAAGGLNGYHNVAMVKGPGITTGRSGVIGNVFYIPEDFWPLNTSLFIKKYNASTPLHAFYVLKFTDLKSLNSGSAVPTLNRNEVHTLEVLVPAKEAILKFEEEAKLLFQKIRHNEKETATLTQLRDTLLPKLMSGEIDVMQIKPEELHEPVLS